SKHFPKVELTIDEIKTLDIVESLHARQLDAGVLATPLSEDGLEEKVLFYEPFFLYAHYHHPLLSQRKVNGKQLNVNELWLLQDGHCFRNQVINFCSAQKTKEAIADNIRFESGNFETLRHL